MDELKCVLADDEPLALSLLESLVRSKPDIEIVAVCRDGREALAAIRKFHPDIAFLDIEMPGLNGFDVVSRLQPESMPAIIFTTAFDRYATRAFDVHAVDYVLKPLNAERLGLAIERAVLRLGRGQGRQAGAKASIMSALGQMSGPDGFAGQDLFPPAERGATETEAPKKLLIRDAGKTHVVEVAGIDWIDAAGDYMCVHVGNDTHIARTTMKKLQSQLDERVFVRVHRSTLVNVQRIREIENLGKGDCILHLDSGITLKASRSYREQLLTLLG